MKRTKPFVRYCLILVGFGVVIVGARVSAQSQTMTPQTPTSQAQTMTPPDRDDVSRRQLASFDSFLDNHPELAEQLRKDPSLVNREEFVENHPELQQYLQQHPEIREEISRNPNVFMHQEQRFDRTEDRDRDRDMTRRELANMDRFMDSHPEIAEQLRKDPSLVNNREFVENHPALQQFLAEHPGVREEYKENPNAFMHQEERFDRREDRRDRDMTRRELANMDRFMDSHPEIAEQLRKDPSLVNNREFVENHPALQQFLAEHPGVREEYKENPNAFMHQEERFDRREDSHMMRRDRDVTGAELSSFHEFMGSHDKIADELSKNPSLANNQEYLENHPALRNYLKAHPEVHEELSENPATFIKSAQQFDPHGTPKAAGQSKPK
jgi:phage-related protein